MQSQNDFLRSTITLLGTLKPRPAVGGLRRVKMDTDQHRSDSCNGGIIFAGLMPHAPVLIPEVGQGREREAGEVVDAMHELSRRALEHSPARIILVSPHSLRRSGSFGIWSESRISGDLSRFRCPEVSIDLPTDPDFSSLLNSFTWPITGTSLDHGASVPLYFLTRAGWDGPTTLLSLNHPGDNGIIEFGDAIRSAAANSSGKTVFIASGDMSHALKPGGPAEYHPRAHEFDHTFVELVKAERYRDITEIDPTLQELAAEDVVNSTVMAASAVGWQSSGNEFLAYQGPFGVGYSVAVLFDCKDNE